MAAAGAAKNGDGRAALTSGARKPKISEGLEETVQEARRQKRIFKGMKGDYACKGYW